MIIETTKRVWVNINSRASQIVAPTPIHKKVSKVVEDRITTLYTPAELQLWEDYNSFPRYIKSSHQKIINSLSVIEQCSSKMLRNVFNMDHMISDVHKLGDQNC